MSGDVIRLAAALADRYRIERELGAGGMATVYLADDLKHHRKVAVKVLRPDLAATLGPDRFLREVTIAANLQHPHILPLYDSGQADGFLYYVMPYIEGPSLRQKLVRDGELPILDAVRILRDIADAMASAHRHGVVHRDIKPENVMLSERHALVTDFGVAKAVSEATGRQTLTTAGVALGTPAYMAPEQAAADPHVDHRADIYGFGAVAYELLTGRPPFTGSSPQAVLAAHVTTTAEPVTNHRAAIPAPLAAMVMRCLEKKPADRWQTADELVTQLEAVLTPSGGTTQLAAIDRQSATLAKVRRRRWRWAIGAVAVIAAVGAVLAIRAVKHPAGTEAPHRPMLAVLPFENLGPPEDEYFADGMTEEVTARLAGLHGLGVIGRTSAIQYKKTTKTIAQIGQELRVEYLLEGTVRWDKPAQGAGPGRVRVTPQLIRVSDQTHLWATVYDAVLADVFGVQSSIATQVAESLDVALLAPERAAIAAKPTANLEAYDFYLRGNEAFRRFGLPAEARRAVQMYQRAVEVDPTFARAYAALAQAHLFLSWVHGRTDQVPLAKAALDRAQQLGPELAETHLVQGYYAYLGSRDYDRALEQFTVVRRQQPNDPDVISSIGLIRRRQGRWAEAVSELARATELDPRNHGLLVELGGTYGWQRRYPEADGPLGKATALAPDIPDYHALRAYLHLMEDGTVRYQVSSATATVVRHSIPPGCESRGVCEGAD